MLESLFPYDFANRINAKIAGNRTALNFFKVGMMKQVAAGLLVGVFLAGSLPVFADGGERRGDGRHWEGREIHRFGDRDLHIWQGGHWRHGRHGGRLGWWWIAAGVWYFYPQPVYPYPDPYTPPVMVINQPPAVVVPPPPPPVIVQPQQTARLWYYCNSAKDIIPMCQVVPKGGSQLRPNPLRQRLDKASGNHRQG